MISVLIFKRSWNIYNLIGLTISLAGTFILLNPTNVYDLNIKYTSPIILATLFYAISINTIRERLKELKPIEIAAGSSFAASIIPFIYIFGSNVNTKINHIIINFTHFTYLIILGLVCTSFAIILFNNLIKRTNALFASSTTYLIPVFAIIWGLIDYEKLDINELIGISIILIGVYTMNSVQNKI
jgi:drug/metabolite transporter (DMT)-like permease